ncbi:hypothetical protein [Psychrobacillus psychrodurans]|uniref:Uncharacterized protein n=1 Tax=Psychrobacillus psychrodurans TaxID=126157 RepID=A0A9X3L8J1_9BACI|nr:hypothetical protein [Psychrobacillus psychrodurans]MCZ8533363.1 hypothetical protein [Psychrobacillus psychrodurans]
MKNRLDSESTPRSESVRYFLTTIPNHQCIANVKQLELPLFEVTKVKGKKLNVLLVYIYILSESEFLELYTLYPEMDVIVNSSNWNQYTTSAKSMAKENNIALFTFKEFMGALNYDNRARFLDYISPEEREENQRNNRSVF